MDGVWGLCGWYWLFIFEGIFMVLFGIVCLFMLMNKLENVRWFDDDECVWFLNVLVVGYKMCKKVLLLLFL